MTQAYLCGPNLAAEKNMFSKTNLKIAGIALGVVLVVRLAEGVLPAPLDSYLGGE